MNATSKQTSRDVLVRRVRRALAATCKAAMKHHELEAELAPLLLERYGKSPNDANCDPYIDAADYGLGTITLTELDALMTEAGYPPNQKP